MSRARNLSGLMGTSATLDVNDIADAADLSGVEIYEDSDAQAAAVYIPGRQIYRRDLGAFQVHNGSSWRTIDFTAFVPFALPGSTSGYITSGNSSANTIRKFPFASSSSVTQVGLLTISTWQTGGVSSKQDGYSVGGYPDGVPSTVISKWPFSSDGNATNVGSLTLGRYAPRGANSETYGYAASGVAGGAGKNTIDKWPFAADGNATDVGDLPDTTYYGTSASSEENGYLMGGATTTAIRKWSFTSDGNATNVGTITIARYWAAGIFSSEHGYTTGGVGAGIPVFDAKHIDRFPFAADGNAAGTGDLTAGRYGHVAASATTHGYVSGAYAPPSANTSMVRFAHGSSTTDVDIGTLSASSRMSAGHQI